MTSTHQLKLDFDRVVPAALEQADTALQILDDWSEGNTTVADEGVARLLAATMHDGPGSALHTFATTGRLDAEEALTEVNDVRVPLEREAWVDALGTYILHRGND